MMKKNTIFRSRITLLLNGNSFNKITWNTTGTNTVRATQRIEGATNMSGQGTGKRIITCTP
ncbi:hypothetical protein CMT77_04400 [Elizabethkingia anophelis]|nr:hypothetical protein [Elizabethkingia anophelis]